MKKTDIIINAENRCIHPALSKPPNRWERKTAHEVYENLRLMPVSARLRKLIIIRINAENRCIHPALSKPPNRWERKTAHEVYENLRLMPVSARLIKLIIIRIRSEEHTSELQSLRHLVCRL